MPEKKLFVGIPIPNALKREIEQWEIKQPFFHNIRWNALKDLHVTILYLGRQKSTTLISNKIKEAAKKIEPFYISVEHFTYFQKDPNALMIRLQLTVSEALVNLQKTILEALVTDSDLVPESLTPHITLARIKNQVTPLKDENQKIRDMLVENIELWETKIIANEIKYTQLDRCDLGVYKY